MIVTGKGGVGKSTLAAALALESAREGRRTLVCEVNTKERVTPLLGKPTRRGRVTLLEENLWAVNVRPHEAMREYALMILRFESIYSAVFENRLVRYFLRFIPSLQELVMLGKILLPPEGEAPRRRLALRAHHHRRAGDRPRHHLLLGAAGAARHRPPGRHGERGEVDARLPGGPGH